MAHSRSLTVTSAPARLPSGTIELTRLNERNNLPSRMLPGTSDGTFDKPVTGREYVERIKEHSRKGAKHSLYPGENFAKLATYMSSRSSSGAHSAAFATIYLLQALENTKDFPSEDLDNPADLPGVDKQLSSQAKGPVHLILFQRGYPTPEWLSTVGSHFGVDPEFFRRHLDFSLFPHQNWFSTPCLPSTSNNVIRLRVTSLARRKVEVPEVENARQDARDDMTQYTKQMSDGLSHRKVDVGCSIVRRFSLHDRKYFSVEQDISICWCRSGKNWTLIVWLDSGKDLTKSVSGPWAPNSSNRLPLVDSPGTDPFDPIPVIRNEPRTAIHSSQSGQKANDLVKRAESFHQSRALLNLDYAQHFEGLDVFDDPFYSIVPIFKYKALAETQFFNLVESLLLEDLELVRFANALATLRASHANLVFHKELLESHARGLREELTSLKSRGGPQWPKSDHPKVVAAAQTLKEDYEWLEERARELSAFCDRGMKDIHDKLTLAESVRSNELADRVNKLTQLATLLSAVYIPLSFTTGFFGMNSKAFGQGSLPLWIWAVTSVPILAISFTVLYFSHILEWIDSLRSLSHTRKSVNHSENEGDRWA